MTTKAQERAALEKIRKIVAGLGENSYIGTAFDGCFEIADQNIEYDFADSFKGRLQLAEEELKAAKAEAETLKLDNRDLRAALEQAKSDASKTITALREKALGADDLDDVAQLLADKVLDLGKEVSNAAQRIVEQADQPGSVEFQNAVKEHRAAQSQLSYYSAVLSRVNAIKSAACAGC